MKSNKRSTRVSFQIQVPTSFAIWLFRKQANIQQAFASEKFKSESFQRVTDTSFCFDITGPALTTHYLILIRSILFQHLPSDLHPTTQNFIAIKAQEKYSK